MALNGLICADVPLSNYSLTHSLLTHAMVEIAKALGGSFKLVTPAPKPVREMTQLLRETQKDGDTQTIN